MPKIRSRPDHVVDGTMTHEELQAAYDQLVGKVERAVLRYTAWRDYPYTDDQVLRRLLDDAMRQLSRALPASVRLRLNKQIAATTDLFELARTRKPRALK